MKRFFIGLLFGIPLVMAFAWLASKDISPIIAYFLVVIPFRWLEWGILLAITSDVDVTFSDVLQLNISNRVAFWLLGGVALSCLLDLLHLWALGHSSFKFVC